MLQTTSTDSLFRAFDPAPQPFGQAGDARTAPNGGRTALLAGAGDGISTPWFQPATPVDSPYAGGGWGAQGGASASGGTQSGAIYGLISSLLGAVQQLVSSLFGGQPGIGQGSGAQQGPGAQQWPGTPQGSGAQQFFADADLGSTGDPHLSVAGTRGGNGGNAHVDERFDSMTSHRDLFDSADVAGGYRVSTSVSQPDANGVTTNRSATVRAGFGRDAITLRGDGSFSVVDDGKPVALAKGASATLSGGETVRANEDGSLLVSAASPGGGSIATTLRAANGHVDVTAHAHDLDLGGDIVNHVP